ncbi:MAG: M23 family metallopeptidase [marine benthic group bacterium]|nr:M23 family metallopeptidase [Gemmatimonadota bacterium]
MNVLLVPLFVLVFGSCASSGRTVKEGEAGDLVVLTTVPAEESDRVSDGADLESDPGVIPDSVIAPGPDFDSLVAVIRSEAAEPRKRTVLPFGVTWTPIAPEEGSAIAFRILAPRGGLVPETVVGRFAEGVVRFGKMGRSWLGFAAVPFDTEGQVRLDLEFRFGDGSLYHQSVALDVTAREWDEATLSVAPRYSSPPPEVQERIARDREQIREVLDHASPQWLLDGAFESPRPFDVTAEFGQKRVFNGELQSRHTGLDLRGQVGKPVHAAGRGRVVLAGDFYFSGNGIFVDHGLGVYTGYFHLSEILVSEGDMVETGDLIGRAGATGRVTGPHLHWSLWVDGTGQDAGNLLGLEIPTP